jgi:MtN3 and saliva related transmembrane protein
MHILVPTEEVMTEAIGWLSSFVLVLTIVKQVYKQWKSGSSEGVSKWLFVGQITASTGFTLYSILVRNWVFVVTNALLLLSAIVGGLIVLKHRRAERRRGGEAPRQAHGARPVHA